MTTTSIGWNQLADDYGPFSDVPRLLERVRKSRRPNQFEEALAELCAHLLHQEAIDRAAVSVVRELIAMVGAESEPGKRASYYVVLNEFADAARTSIKSDGSGADGDEIRIELVVAREQFTSDVNHPEPAVRLGAGRLLVAFETVDRQAVDVVRRRYLMEPEQEVRYALFEGLVRVRLMIDDWRDVLAVGLAWETEPKFRFPVLSAQTEEIRPTAEDRIWPEFVDLFVSSGTTEPEHFFEAVHRLGRETECALLMEALMLTREELLVCPLAERILRAAFEDQRGGWDTRAVSWMKDDGSSVQQARPRLLQLMLRWRVRPAVATTREGTLRVDYTEVAGEFIRPLNLNELQRTVLVGLADCQQLWHMQTNLWDLFSLESTASGLIDMVHRD